MITNAERMEMIKSFQIEGLGNKRVMEYCVSSMRLMTIDDVVMVQPLADCENLLVISF